MSSFLIAIWLSDSITVLIIRLQLLYMFSVCYLSIGLIQMMKYPFLSFLIKLILRSSIIILHFPNYPLLLINIFKIKNKKLPKKSHSIELIQRLVFKKNLKKLLCSFKILGLRLKKNWNFKINKALCLKLIFSIKFYLLSSGLMFLSKSTKIHQNLTFTLRYHMQKQMNKNLSF